MTDCLPVADDWSAPTQIALIQDHLLALRHHLEALEAAVTAEALLQALPHLTEINARSLEAHDLLQALRRRPAQEWKELKVKPC